MAFEEAGVKLVAEGESQFISAMDRAEKSVRGFGDATEGASSRINVAQAAITGAFVAVASVAVEAFATAARAVGDFIGGAIESAANFEQGMSILQAASGATADEMQQLSKRAIELGNDLTLPDSSASDAAAAMLELSKAGLDVNDTLNATKGVLQLATAAQIDNAEAAAITAQALNTFHLEGSEAVKIADMLSAGANASSASITDLAAGFQQAGFAFEANNQQADDLITSLSLLTNVGLTGSDAGTALKNAMIKLAAPTKQGAAAMEALGINVFDSEGKMKSMREIIEIFNTSMAGMTEEQRVATLNTILLSDGMKAFIPLLDAGVSGFDEMNKKVNENGAASKMAEAQMKGFKGAQAAFNNTMETFALIVGQALLPVLTDLLQNYIIPGAQWVMNLVQSFIAASEGAGGMTGALTAMIPGFDTVITIVQSLQPVIQTVFSFIAALIDKHGESIRSFLESAWQKISVIIGLAVELISTVITKVFNFVAKFIEEHGDKIMKFLEATWNAIKLIIETALAIIESVIKIVLAAINGDWETVWTEIENLAKTVWDAIVKLIDAALELIKTAIDLALAFLTTLFEDAWNKIKTGVETKWNEIKAAIESELTNIKTAAENVVNTVIGFFEKLPEKLSQIGATAIQSLIDSLNAGLQPIRDAISAILEAIRSIQLPTIDLGFGGSSFSSSSVKAPPAPGQTFARLPGAGNTISNARNFNLTLNTAQASAGVIRDFAIMEALAG